jgi:Protein of unknown function (DUF2911)
MHILLLVLALAPSPQRPDTGFFVTRLGRDTLAVERFTFDGRVLDGVSVLRSPNVVVRAYHGHFGADGRPDSLIILAGPAGKPPVQSTVFRYRDDTVTIETRRDTTVRRRAFAISGHPIPFSPDVIAPWQLALRQLVASDAGTMVLYASGAGLPYRVTRVGGDTLDLDIADHDYGPLRAGMDGSGHLTFLDFRATTDKYLAERVETLAVDSLTAVFAARELAGAGMGLLSPRDTVRATVGGAQVLVDYGRPSMRGRVVFGGIVPWDVVWRTGANEATQLITDKDLVIGGTRVPAGTYSLFTLPSPRGWQLIVNKQHGQWGTDYDSTQDLARIPMRVLEQIVPYERLTIRILGDTPRQTIAIQWERTAALVDVSAK